MGQSSLFSDINQIIKNYQNSGMSHIQSPFIQTIPECKASMRKLRKKIYKYTSTHRPTKKPKDSIHNIITLLKPRKLPDFLIDSLKKRRNFDLSSIKNVIVPPGANFEKMKSMSSQQEAEIQILMEEHKKRMVETNQRKNSIKFERKSTSYSSTSESSGMFEESSELQPSEAVPSLTHDSDSPCQHNCEVFRNDGYLALERDMFSQGEQWLKF